MPSIYSYITGIANERAAEEEVMKYLTEDRINNYKRTIKTYEGTLSLRYDPGGRHVDGIRGVSLDVNRCLCYFILRNGFFNSLESPDTALHEIISGDKHVAEVLAIPSNMLYSTKPVPYMLERVERDKVINSQKSLTPSDQVFCEVLSVYKGQFVDVTKPVLATDIPLVKTTVKKRAVSLGQTLPSVVENFIENLTLYYDFFSDDVNILKAQTVEQYVDSIFEFFTSEQNLNLRNTAIDQVSKMALIHMKPASLSYDNRSIWIYKSIQTVQDFLRTFFNYTIRSNFTAVKPYVRVEENDHPHELNSYLSRLAKSQKYGRAPIEALKLMVSAIEVFIESNRKADSTPLFSLFAICIYYSIYGTNSRRIVKRPQDLSIILQGKSCLVNFNIVEKYFHAKSVELKINACRYCLRQFANLTLFLRFRYSLYFNKWKEIQHVDGRLCFDTVNYCPVLFVPKHLVNDYYTIVKFIRTNWSIVSGSDYPNQI